MSSDNKEDKNTLELVNTTVFVVEDRQKQTLKFRFRQNFASEGQNGALGGQ
jgi:hypothetical protein